jgi:spermidine synthase
MAVPLPALAWAVAPLLFTSGFCALVYQIAWQRELRLIFGGSTAASAAVIAVFMGGLGLGGRVLGPRADARENPLRFYAALEAAVALTAAAVPVLSAVARRVYLATGGTAVLGLGLASAVRILLAGLVLLTPTFLAGGTLGAAARAVEEEGDRRRRATALLYGVNTLGAVAGCLVATFWLLERFGTRGTVFAAALVNLVVAGAAAMLAKRSRPREEDEETRGRESYVPPRWILLGSAVVGFAFFLLEIVWYRMLAPILGGTVYTFGLVLAVALLGIGLGGVLYAVAFVHAPVGLSAFAATCLTEAAMVALPYALGDRLALLAFDLRPPAGSRLASYLGGWTLVTAIVVLPAAIVAGAQFPLLVALLGEGRSRVARHLGRAYFWNTVGAIAGALAGGFGLLPLLTAPGCWRLVALLLVLLGVLAVLVDPRRPRWGWGVSGLGAAVVGLALLAEGPTPVWRHSGIGAGRASTPAATDGNGRRAWIHQVRRSVGWEREGVESSVAVESVAGLSFVVNGKVDGNARGDAPTQVMGGLLGPLLRPGARRSLVIGLGTGSTAGWLAAAPGMERTDVIELEGAIRDIARMCDPVSRQAMQNPAVRVLTGDAREVLMAGRERYDLVFSEPSNPYRAGVASLFTREFYRAVASRLEPGGLFLQWLQAYDVDERTVSTVIATLAEVFPEVEVWQVHHIDLLLVASSRPLRHQAGDLRARIRAEPFGEALAAAWRATTLEDVLARFVAGPALARHLRETGHTVNTDDRNPVEFAFARTLSRSGAFDVLGLRQSAAALSAERPPVDGTVDWARVARQRLAIHTLAGAAAALPPEASESERLRAQAHAEYVTGKLAAAVQTFSRQKVPPEGAVETTLFAEGLADAGDSAAVPYIQALKEVEATEAEAAAARLAFRLGNAEMARDALVSALVHYRGDPWPSQIAMAHALALAEELAVKDRGMVPVLLEALGQPFAVSALEEPRRQLWLRLAAIAVPPEGCAGVLDAFEPNVPWTSDVLRYRASCYRRIQDRRAAQAEVDLQEYLHDQPAGGNK